METKDSILMFIKLLVFLPFIIFLIYFFFKYGGSKLQEIQKGKYMKILDRMALSNDNSILIVKIGEKGYVISSSQGKVEIMMELSQIELMKLEESNKIEQFGSFKEATSKLMLKRKIKDEEK